MTDQPSSQGWPDDWNRSGPSQPTTPIWAPGVQQTGSRQEPDSWQQPGAARQPGAAQQPGGAQQRGPSQAGQAQPGPQPRAYQQAAYQQRDYARAEYEQQDYQQAGYQQADYQPSAPPARQGAEAKGFLGALFDFSFSSFVTTRIIKVLYVLILILTALSALIFTISAFRLNMTFGLLTLVIGDPLFIIIVMAFWRLVLETFIVVFRIADDVRAIRERDR